MGRIVIGMSGASGSIYGIRLLEALEEMGIERHLIVSDWAKSILEAETAYTMDQVKELATKVYDPHDMAAAVSSGSFLHDGMVVAPCSMKTLAAIHSGFHDSLLGRAADVTLKEGRRLVLVPRETPLSTIHLRNMYELSMMSIRILPPVPAFYHQPKTIDDIVEQTVGRILDQFGLHSDKLARWEG